MDKQSADILRRAKALIDRPEKWCKFDYGMRGAVMCAQGALFFAIGEGKDFTACFLLLRAHGWFTTPTWNDHHSTTHADVMAAFDRAIALAEGRISDDAYTARFISEVVESVKSQEVAV